MNSTTRRYFWLLCLAVVAGCHSAEDPALTDEAEAPTPVAVAPAKVSNAGAPTPTLANPKVTAAQAEFKPPFQARELFEPPKRAQGMVRRDDEHGQSVELKGFINVDGPRVVLSIDNVITIIPEGGEKHGVRVRSIQPPTVILERGRNRWPATLE